MVKIKPINQNKSQYNSIQIHYVANVYENYWCVFLPYILFLTEPLLTPVTSAQTDCFNKVSLISLMDFILFVSRYTLVPFIALYLPVIVYNTDFAIESKYVSGYIFYCFERPET